MRIHTYTAGWLDFDAAADGDIADAHRLALILTGQDPDYGGMGRWNADGGLAAFLRQQLAPTLCARLGIEAMAADDTEAVEQALLGFALRLAYAEGAASKDPASNWRGIVDQAVATYTDLLLGLPAIDEVPDLYSDQPKSH